MDAEKVMETLNRLCKWRSVFAGWQLGTRPSGDPECDAVRDHREATLLLRAEVNALTAILKERGILPEGEFEGQLANEAEHLMRRLEKRFPGFKAEPWGMVIDARQASETTRGWKP